jgi:DNA-binding NarL/FixJ family response regulator
VSKIRALIVDDHPLFRQGLHQVLETEGDVEIVGEASDGREAVHLAVALTPDVVLVDINIPSINGLEVTRQIKDRLTRTAVIVLTAYHDEGQELHAHIAGAAAYFPKDVTPKELIDAVHNVSHGLYVLDGRAMSHQETSTWLQHRLEQESRSHREVTLTPREMEILRHIAQGKSNKAIAHALGISEQTVKNHTTSMMQKLRVNDRTEAVVYALRQGWIRLQDTNLEPQRKDNGWL